MIYKCLIKVLVNLLTTSRIVFSFVLLTMIQTINSYHFIGWLAILFFSDFLDGFLAREFNVQTLYGSTMDTIADKVLCILLIFPLLKESWIFSAVLIGEIGISLLNIVGKLKGKHTCSSRAGKVKMWLLASTILLGYIYYFNYIYYEIIVISGIITCGIQGYVILEYNLYLKNQLPQKRKLEYKIKDYQDIFYVLFDTNYFLENIQSQD